MKNYERYPVGVDTTGVCLHLMPQRIPFPPDEGLVGYRPKPRFGVVGNQQGELGRATACPTHLHNARSVYRISHEPVSSILAHEREESFRK